MIAPLLLVVAIASQPPAPSGGNKERQPQPQQTEPGKTEPSPVERGTDANPLIVRTSPSDKQAADDATERNDQRANRRYTLGLTALTVAVICFQAFLLKRQNKIMDRQHAAAVAQASHMEEGLRLTRNALDISRSAAEAAVIGAQATVGNTDAAIMSGKIANDALSTNREIERAYISMNHSQVRISWNGVSDGQGGLVRTTPKSIDLQIDFHNSGRTPGDMLGGFVGWRVAAEPGLPDLSRVINPLTPAFLLPDKSVDFGIGIVEDEATLTRVMEGRDPADRLWLIAEIDYADRFGGYHTFGYGRCFSPSDRERPSFLFTGQTGRFNYDQTMSAAKRQHYGITKAGAN